jgi:hypothetical protein
MLRVDAEETDPNFKISPIFADGRIKNVGQDNSVEWLLYVKSMGYTLPRKDYDIALTNLQARVQRRAWIRKQFSTHPTMQVELLNRLVDGIIFVFI